MKRTTLQATISNTQNAASWKTILDVPAGTGILHSLYAICSGGVGQVQITTDGNVRAFTSISAARWLAAMGSQSSGLSALSATAVPCTLEFSTSLKIEIKGDGDMGTITCEVVYGLEI